MQEVFFNGSKGKIEGRYHKSHKENPPVVLVLHPHPLQGANMNNPIVQDLANSFIKEGFSVLKFNFRGVGKSQGQFDKGIGELIDAATALDWLQEQNPASSSFWIAGFSFGAWIALQLLMRRPEIQAFVCVSTPSNKYDFTFLSPCPAYGLFAQAGLDLGSKNSTVELVSKLSRQRNSHIEYSLIEEANHLFLDKREELSKIVQNYIRSVVNIIGTTRVKPDKRRKMSVVAEQFEKQYAE